MRYSLKGGSHDMLHCTVLHLEKKLTLGRTYKWRHQHCAVQRCCPFCIHCVELFPSRAQYSAAQHRLWSPMKVTIKLEPLRLYYFRLWFMERSSGYDLRSKLCGVTWLGMSQVITAVYEGNVSRGRLKLNEHCRSFLLDKWKSDLTIYS